MPSAKHKIGTDTEWAFQLKAMTVPLLICSSHWRDYRAVWGFVKSPIKLSLCLVNNMFVYLTFRVIWRDGHFNFCIAIENLSLGIADFFDQGHMNSWKN